MNHLLLFIYFLLLSTGFAGITMLIILLNRTKEPLLGWILGISSGFSIWLLLSLLIFYAETIARVPRDLYTLDAGLTVFFGITVYIGFFLFALGVSRRIVKKMEQLPHLLIRLPFISAIPVLLLYLFSAVLISNRTEMQAFVEQFGPSLNLSIVFATALFLIHMGYILQKAGTLELQGSLKFLILWLGRSILCYAPAAVLLSIILSALKVAYDPTVILNYLFFAVWNGIIVIAFIKYLTKPAALIDDKGISNGFLKEYSISKREAEVIELISHGLSNKEIAAELNISFTTARTHIYNIFKKTQAANRVELLRLISGFRD